MTGTPDCVELITDRQVRVAAARPPVRALLARLGARRRWSIRPSWTIPYATERELGAILMALRDAGVAFVGSPHGWPPAAVFEEFRQRGLIAGVYQEVTWAGPGRPATRER